MSKLKSHEVKEKVQTRGLRIWYKTGCRGTLQYATGVGKTRIGVRAAEWIINRAEIKDPKVLILSPTENIRDKEWKTEFKKCKMTAVWEKVESLCIQTAYKIKGEEYDLVIADEIHNFLSPEYFKFFENNQIDRILGLSAFVPKELQYEYLDGLAPIRDIITIEQAMAWGLVAPYKFYNIPCHLNEIERAIYDELTLKIDHLKTKMATKPWGFINKRKSLLYDTEEKSKTALDVVKFLREHYGIIFTETINSAIGLANLIEFELGIEPILYHSKMTRKAREEALKKYSDGRTKNKILITPRALNEGANLPRLVWALVYANTSKPKEQIQRIGRTVRFEPNKRAIIIKLFAPHTVEVYWVRNSQRGQKTHLVKSIEEITLEDFNR